MSKISITLINKTTTTTEWLLSLGISPAIVDNIKEVNVELEVETDKLFNNNPADSAKINALKDQVDSAQAEEIKEVKP